MSYAPPYKSYVGNGTTKEFTFDYELLKTVDISVYVTPTGQPYNPADDLVPSTEYTVVISLSPAVGGTVTFDTPPANQSTVVLVRSMEETIVTSFKDVETFSGLALDNAIHRIELLIQQNDFLANNRALHYPINAPSLTGNITQVQPLGDGQYWKRVGNAIIAVTPSPGDEDTLRSELASEVEGGDGAGLVGFYNKHLSKGEKLNDALNTNIADTFLSRGRAPKEGLEVIRHTTNLILVSTGTAWDGRGYLTMTLPQYMEKNITSPWSEGSTGGAVFPASLPANSFVYVFIIATAEGGRVDIGIDTSAVAVNRPAEYIYFRPIALVFTGTTTNTLMPFTESGYKVNYSSGLETITGTHAYSTAIDVNVPRTVPFNASIKNFNVNLLSKVAGISVSNLSFGLFYSSIGTPATRALDLVVSVDSGSNNIEKSLVNANLDLGLYMTGTAVSGATVDYSVIYMGYETHVL